MAGLFDFDNKAEGYRLDKFEFYNWGAFDNRIWSIEPKGNSSLLTGGNGSGKTTLVDALVTLLVPPVQRHYNQSSGAEKKKERTEKSYVLGAVGSMRDEEQGSARVEYLRKRNIYSILLGSFRNESLDKILVLGQIRWFTPSGEMSRLYFSCTDELDIKQDIHPLDSGGKYRKRLTAKFPIRFYDSFQQYSLSFIKAFGFRSEKALSLFSQTVGVKVLGNLNDFIRTHMLERPSCEDSFNSLYNNYQTLLGAHKQIEKSEKQLALLEPIMKSSASYEACSRDIEKKESLSKSLPGLFIRYKSEALIREEQLLNDKKEHLHLNLDNKNREMENGDKRLFAIRQELEGNKTAIRLSVLENEIEHSKDNLERSRQDFKVYDNYTSLAGLRTVENLADFQENRKSAQDRKNEGQVRNQNLQDEIYHSKRDIDLFSRELSLLDKEISSLSKRKNNIPHHNIELRRKICEDLSLEEDALPYAGELLRVKKEESLWVGAVEKILHGFALCLLVPEEYYKQVNDYVNSHDLKGRLIYYRIKTASEKGVFSDWKIENDNETLLPAKLEIKKDTPFENWLQDTLARRFTYSCVEEIDRFSRYDMAVTPRGLIKNKNRHEKDDRPKQRGEGQYVLGWDNRNKLKVLMQQKGAQEGELEKLKQVFGKLEAEQNEQGLFISLLDKFLEIQTFEKIDWFSKEKNLHGLESEKAELLSASDDLKRLEALKKEQEGILADLKDEMNRLQKLQGRIEQDEEHLIQRRDDLTASRILADPPLVDPDDFKEYLPPFMELPWQDLINLQLNVSQKFDDEIRTFLEKKTELTASLIRRMQEFINPSAVVLDEFPGWTGETSDMEAHQDNIQVFRSFYERLKKDNLPRFRKKFREFLNERMLEDLIGFRESLDREERSIIKSIDELNRSLKRIEYNKIPPSYISLLGESSKDVAIREFKTALKHSMGDAGKIALGDEAELENTFYKMQSLIMRLKEDDNFRKKVLDVRNWLEFSAIEKYCEDDSQKQYYQDSHSLSGGEKAKLAYTILASAIAYQFGINSDGEKSFRFVIVDEAFSKVDPENAAYAMKLFRNLSLQLMVVTPLDKINLVEDYIESVHYVKNKDQISSLYNLTFQDYEKLKKEHTT
jgi:uncharacterized protein YPO0396